MFRKIFTRKASQGAGGGAAGHAAEEINPQTLLAQAQERLQKLRTRPADQDAFPSLNEATRIVSQLDDHVHHMAPEDPLRPVWIQQVGELQKELNNVTETIVTKLSTEPAPPKTHPEPISHASQPGPTTGAGGMDDLFSGLNVSGMEVSQETAPPAAATQPARQKSAETRPPLDEDLFSDLMATEAVPTQKPTTTSESPESPGSLSRPDSKPASRTSHIPAPAMLPVPVQSGGTKKKKKATRLGYAREPDARQPPASQQLPSTMGDIASLDVETTSAGVPVQSTVGENGHEAGKGLEGGLDSAGQHEPEQPDGSLVQEEGDGVLDFSGLEFAGDSEEGQVADIDPVADEVSEVDQMANEIDRVKKQMDSEIQGLAGKLEDLGEEESRCCARRLELLEEYTNAKVKIVELEGQQQVAVESDDYELAANLASQIESFSAQLDACVASIKASDQTLQSCRERRLAVQRKQVEVRKSGTEKLALLQEREQGNLCAVQTKTHEEVESAERDISEKLNAISEENSRLPEARRALEAEREQLEAKALDSSQEWESEKTRLEAARKLLCEEIEDVRAQLAAKEQDLEAIDTEIADLADVKDDSLESGMHDIEHKMNELENREARLEGMRKAADEKQASCQALKEEAAEKLAQCEKQIQELGELQDEYTASISTLTTAIAREEGLKGILEGLLEAEEEADRKLEALQKECSMQRDALKKLASDKAKLSQDIRLIEDQIVQADARLPEIEDLKKSAAAGRDFKEAARLASRAKDVATEKEKAQEELEKLSASMSDMEASQRTLSESVELMEGQVKDGRRACALARYRALLAHKTVLPVTAKEDFIDPHAKLAQQLTAEFEFDSDVFADVEVRIKELM